MVETLHACKLCDSLALRRIDYVAELSECRHCGYVFNNPRPSRDEIAEFYSQPAKYDKWIANEKARDELWMRRLEKMQSHAIPGSLLDVGTGTGQFLAHARHCFSPCIGTEVSLEGKRIAESRYGIDVLHGELEDAELPDGSLENITMFHVLEHVHDPRAVLQKCHRLLVDGGRLFIAVPNDRRVITRIMGAALRIRARVAPKFGRAVPSPTVGSTGLPRLSLDGEVIEVHLSHFTAPVLVGLLERQGFRNLDVSADPFFVAAGVALTAHEALYQIGSLLAHQDVHLYPTLWLAAEKR